MDPDPSRGGDAVVERRRKGVLRRQAVVEAGHPQTRHVGEPAADAVVGVERADHPAAAMDVEHAGRGGAPPRPARRGADAAGLKGQVGSDRARRPLPGCLRSRRRCAPRPRHVRPPLPCFHRAADRAPRSAPGYPPSSDRRFGMSAPRLRRWRQRQSCCSHAVKRSCQSGCQRDKGGRFSMMSWAAHRMRRSSRLRGTSLSGQRM